MFNRATLVLAWLCLLTSSGGLVVAEDANVTMSPSTNSSDSVVTMSVTAIPGVNSSSASSPSDSSASTSSPSAISPTPSPTPSSTFSSTSMPSSSMPSSSMPSSSPSFSSQPSPSSASASAAPSPSPTSDEGILISSSVSASSANIIITSKIPAQTTTVAVIHREMNDPTYLPIVAAIVSGFGLLFLLFLLLLTMALVYRHLGKEDSTMIMKKPKKGADAFYDGLEPQSAQYLVSSMSNASFATSPSDGRLDSHLHTSPGVHYNRGFDVDHNPSGANGHDDGFKPIQIVAADVNPRASSTKV